MLCHDGLTMRFAACSAGIEVPRELSIVAFDNNAASDWRIGVDRMLVPFRAIARHAVEELCGLIEAPAELRPPVVLPFEFQQAGTVARPPADRQRPA